MVKTILEYFLHPSTWKGLIAIVSAAGILISPELAEKVIAAGLGLIGLIQVLIDDAEKTKALK